MAHGTGIERHVQTWMVAIAVVGPVPGCGVLNADDYAVVDVPVDAGTVASVELPPLPALPDDDPVLRASCEACAEEKCQEYRQACLESERCTALLACHGKCDDPNCIWECRDTGPESPAFEDYFGCVFGPFGDNDLVPGSQCSEECRAGANWGCTEHYRWGSPESPATVDVSTYMRQGRALGSALDALAYAQIAACDEFLPQNGLFGGDVGCDAPVPVDYYGGARLVLGSRRSAFIVRDTQTGVGNGSRVYGRPVLRSGHLELVTFHPAVRDVWVPWRLAQAIPPIEVRADQGVVFFWTRDCTGASGAARVEIDAGTGSPDHFGWRNWADPDPTIEVGGAGAFVNVPPGPNVELTAYHLEETGKELARRSVIVAAGWETNVVLLPLPRP